MAEMSEEARWPQNTKTLIAGLVAARFVLEVAGASHAVTQFLSSTVALFLGAIYLGAVAPLRGVTRIRNLVLPSMVLTLWTVGWVVSAIIVSAVLQFHGSHFPNPEDFSSWSQLRAHVTLHLAQIPVYAVLVFILMAVPFFVHRWPVTVGPVAVLGALVVIRYWVEGMGLDPTRASAWSSTVAVLLSGLYLGAMGPRLGLEGSMPFFIPAIVIAWAWRFWVFLAAVVGATFPVYKTHFFDPSRGRAAVRLVELMGVGILEGFVFGVVIWIMAMCISRATRRTTAA